MASQDKNRPPSPPVPGPSSSGTVTFHLFFYNFFVFYSVSYHDPHGSALILFGWILIRFANADPDPGGQK
jgi:hypothetical protein